MKCFSISNDVSIEFKHIFPPLFSGCSAMHRANCASKICGCPLFVQTQMNHQAFYVGLDLVGSAVHTVEDPTDPRQGGVEEATRQSAEKDGHKWVFVDGKGKQGHNQ